jgi:hypothetical protein
VDGQVVPNPMNYRSSKPARLAINIWTINVFKEDNPNALIESIDL